MNRSARVLAAGAGVVVSMLLAATPALAAGETATISDGFCVEPNEPSVQVTLSTGETSASFSITVGYDDPFPSVDVDADSSQSPVYPLSGAVGSTVVVTVFVNNTESTIATKTVTVPDCSGTSPTPTTPTETTPVTTPAQTTDAGNGAGDGAAEAPVPTAVPAGEGSSPNPPTPAAAWGILALAATGAAVVLARRSRPHSH